MKRVSLYAVLAVAATLAACEHRPTSAPDAALAAGATKAHDAQITNAVMTVVNNEVDGTGNCANGAPDPQNCNLYAAKNFVWLGGEKLHGGGGLPDGVYVFAVLQPGGQASPVDGDPKNLSDATPTTHTPGGDSFDNRMFTLDGGVIGYEGTHTFDATHNKIRLFPYDDTPNAGGEYIMAVCRVTDLSTGSTDPSNCKYDAFKVKTDDPAAAPTVSKTAAGASDRTYAWTITKSVDKTETHNGTGTFNYTVVATRDAGTVGNVRVTGAITITNTNTDAVAITGITDVLSDNTACTLASTPTSLNPGTTTLNYSCALTAVPAQPLGNVVTITWAAQKVGTLSLAAGSATASVNPVGFTENAIDASATVGDSQVDGGLGTTSATKTFTYSKTFSYDVIDQCQDFPNTATVTGNDTHAAKSASQSVKVCAGAKPLTAAKTAAGVDTRTYGWTIAKSTSTPVIKTATGGGTASYSVTVTRDGGTVSNVHVSGAITVHNPNAGAVANVTIADVLSNGTTCSVTNPPASIASGDTQLSYSCDLAALPTGALNNTATVTWPGQDVGGHILDAGSATATVTGIAFTETAVDASVNVSDTFGSFGTANGTNTFTYTHDFAGDPAGTCTTHPNTASFTTNNSGATGSSSANVKVCVGSDLTASKTAAPSYTRTYAWNVAKNVDKTIVKQVGGTATFSYGVNANQTGSTDSNWQVTGAITVNNPNDWEAVTVNLADAIDNGGSCSVSGGSSVSVPASGSASRAYVCSYGAAPAVAAYNNVATASWDASFATPHQSAQGTASGSFGDPTTRVNTSVSVVDTFNGTPSTLGSLSANDAIPATGSWNYTHTVPSLADQCVTYNNIAAYTSNNGATGSSSKSVMVCGGVAGGLTMGYWKNNGYKVITGSGTCAVATWLRQYAPFQDLSATATCAQTVTWISNVLTAASAAGAAMNPMLKGQMLATALDVYYSDPSLGGNKISAPAPIGGVKVDLTVSGNGPAFGGATGMTVSQLLAYAAGQTTDGGVTWYGQNKTIQELAKNIFDDINNARAIVAP